MEYIDLTAAAQLTPHRVTPATVWRWARRGIMTRIGHVVQLRHVRIGARVYTTAAWFDDFFREVAETDGLAVQHRNRIVRRATVAEHAAIIERLEEHRI
jgi:hypothetical protein